MAAFEFGYAVGANEKFANFGVAILRGALNQNPLVHAGLGAAGYAPVGAALGAYRAPQGQKLRGAGRGALTGAAAGATGGAASALAAKAIGGTGGIIARGMVGGTKNHLINQVPNLAGIGGLVGGYQLAKQQPQAKAANAGAPTAFKSDAHPTSFIPLVGGAISGAVRPNPSRGPVSNVLGEGGAGLAGGLRGGFGGAALGAGLGALRGVRGLGAGAAIGGLLGSAIGTHRGAQTFRENTPLNARALEMLKAQPAAAPVKAATFGSTSIVAPGRRPAPPRFTLPQGVQQRAR